MKLRLDPKRRGELIDQIYKIQDELTTIAKEIGSMNMIDRVNDVSEVFFRRLSKDKNLVKGIDIEAEMDDDSGEENDILDMEVEI